MTSLAQRMLISLIWLISASLPGSCSRGDKVGRSAIQVEQKGSSLDVSVGQEIAWWFSAKRSGRDISIIDVASPRLPFGVKAVYEPGKFGFKGKVLGREFRSGLIQVIAFDKVGCEQGYADMKRMVEQNMRQTNATEATIPIDPCKASTAVTDPAMEQYISKAHFYWNMSDGVDELEEDNYRQVAQSLACEAAGACLDSEKFYSSATTAKGNQRRNFPRNHYVVIPTSQAPLALDLVIGECARFERRECGQDKSCVWNRSSCVTAVSINPKHKEGTEL
jgi:hypothetical protein